MPKPEKVWDAEIVVSAIKKLHHDGEQLDVTYARKHHSALYQAAFRYCKGWRQAVQTAGLSYRTIKRKPISKGKKRRWSREAVITSIIQRASCGDSIKGSIVYDEDSGLYNAARKYFGKQGWAKARIAAGLPPYDPRPNLKWTQETVRAEILRLKQEQVPLNHGYMLCTPQYGYIRWAAQNVFGSWRNAIEASGIDYEEVCVEPIIIWDTQTVTDAIKSLDGDGVRLSSKSIQISHSALFAGAIRVFGCWSRAVEAAGISYRQHARIWSTKAWLRSMEDDEYESLLEKASTHIGKRSR